MTVFLNKVYNAEEIKSNVSEIPPLFLPSFPLSFFSSTEMSLKLAEKE
jgi:hypothetical protein